MVSIPYSYLNNGDWGGALNWVMSDYVGYGFLWIFIGIILASLVMAKTKSYGITGIVFIVYCVAISAALPIEVGQYFLLLIGIMLSIMVIKLWLSR